MRCLWSQDYHQKRDSSCSKAFQGKEISFIVKENYLVNGYSTDSEFLLGNLVYSQTKEESFPVTNFPV